MIKQIVCVGFLVVCLAMCGCGGKAELKKYSVSGTVTIDGQPLSEGEVYFRTVESATIDAVPIKAGRFQGEAQAGSRRVEIVALREVPPDPAAVAMYGDKAKELGAGRENSIPPKYNTESTLTAEVKPGGPNEFKFDVTSK